MTEIYRTTVTEVGPEASSFIAQGMLVTFGEEAPDALREFCFLVDASARTTADLQAGQCWCWTSSTRSPPSLGGPPEPGQPGSRHGHRRRQKSAYMHGAIHVEGEEVPRLEVGWRDRAVVIRRDVVGHRAYALVAHNLANSPVASPAASSCAPRIAARRGAS